jgi:hypothetical protein
MVCFYATVMSTRSRGDDLMQLRYHGLIV